MLSSAFVDRLLATGSVRFIGIGGSHSVASADAASDIDVYVVTDAPIDLASRRAIAADLADADRPRDVPNDFWGDGDYLSIGGVWHDVMYWDAGWLAATVTDRIERHLPAEGYSTAFLHTLAHLEPVHDPAGEIAAWQRRLATYPDALAEAIIRRNLAAAAGVRTSYRAQIARAVALDDPVSANHRVAALLACVFDAAFAHLRMWHPGEKRQLRFLAAHAGMLPPGFADHVLAVLEAAAPGRLGLLVDAVDALVADAQQLARDDRTTTG
ncbi:DUF4037 domain-containing protein [Propioniciclava sp.]|uniref:DUF4037 domain-containing protein n=1 Tax=Propioniciclava sp. TaxID=2038686 RepID=UPI00260CF2B6|nr:DUF4037 domain-containing protein [Propioniciclava sp.]